MHVFVSLFSAAEPLLPTLAQVQSMVQLWAQHCTVPADIQSVCDILAARLQVLASQDAQVY